MLELYPHAEWRRAMDAAGTDELRTWHELAPEDPWRLYLSDLRWDRSTGILTPKLFVHRTSGEIDDSRREHLRLYTLAELTALLAEAGFEQVEAAGGWRGEPYEEGTSELLIVSARARGLAQDDVREVRLEPHALAVRRLERRQPGVTHLEREPGSRARARNAPRV